MVKSLYLRVTNTLYMSKFKVHLVWIYHWSNSHSVDWITDFSNVSNCKRSPMWLNLPSSSDLSSTYWNESCQRDSWECHLYATGCLSKSVGHSRIWLKGRTSQQPKSLNCRCLSSTNTNDRRKSIITFSLIQLYMTYHPSCLYQKEMCPTRLKGRIMSC